MIYIMSDIHGNYEKFVEALKVIDFQIRILLYIR